MYKVGLGLLLFLGTVITSTAVATAQSIRTCQLSDLTAISQLAEEEVKRALADEPFLRFLSLIVVPSRRLQLHSANHSTLLNSDSTLLAEISLSTTATSAVTSSNNLLAYRPRYQDNHYSNLGAIFINLEGVFPCIVPLTDYYPICHILVEEGDGFRGGRALIDSGDSGNHFYVFNSTALIASYAIAIQNCPLLNATCFPLWSKLSVACYLPRATCSG